MNNDQLIKIQCSAKFKKNIERGLRATLKLQEVTRLILTDVFYSQSSKDLRTLHETKVKHLSVCELEITYASLYGDKVTKL